MSFYTCKTLVLQSLKNPSRFCRHPLSSSPSSIFSVFFSSSSRHDDIPIPGSSITDHLVTRSRNPNIAYSVVRFLEESGFSQMHLDKVIKKVPEILDSDLEATLKPKIRMFEDRGFSPSDIADIITSDPWILTRNLDHKLDPLLLTLRNILGSNTAVVKVLKGHGWFMKFNLENTLIPNIEFLTGCGVSIIQISRYLQSYPRLFLKKSDSIKELARRTDELGVHRNSKMYLLAIRVLGSMTMDTWNSKLQLFKDLGFSEDDIVFNFRRLPQAFAVSERKIKQITTFLLREGFDISVICRHPQFLIWSLEKRIKPRFKVLKNLERRKLLSKTPALLTVFLMTDDQFLKRFVLPFQVKSKYLF